MKPGKDLERVEVPISIAAIVLRRVEPLVRSVAFLFNREWLDRVLLSAYMQGLMDGEKAWRAVFEREPQAAGKILAEEWPG